MSEPNFVPGTLRFRDYKKKNAKLCKS